MELFGLVFHNFLLTYFNIILTTWQMIKSLIEVKKIYHHVWCLDHKWNWNSIIINQSLFVFSLLTLSFGGLLKKGAVLLTLNFLFLLFYLRMKMTLFMTIVPFCVPQLNVKINVSLIKILQKKNWMRN